MKKRKITITVCCVLLVITILISTSIFIINIKNRNREQVKISNEKRYATIKRDIDKELQRYMYVIAPKCQKNNSSYVITHKTLVYNAGMDKEKFLDVDNESYCKAYIKNECIEDGKWQWKITLSCKYYKDKDYENWHEEFPKKN